MRLLASMYVYVCVENGYFNTQVNMPLGSTMDQTDWRMINCFVTI